MSTQPLLFGGERPVDVHAHLREGRPVVAHRRRALTDHQRRFAGAPSFTLERVPRRVDGSTDEEALRRSGLVKVTIRVGDPVAVWSATGRWSRGFLEHVAADQRTVRVSGLVQDVGAIYPLADIVARGLVEPMDDTANTSDQGITARTREGTMITAAPSGAAWFGSELVLPAVSEAAPGELLERQGALKTLLHDLRTFHLPAREVLARLEAMGGAPLAKGLDGPVEGWLARLAASGEEPDTAALLQHVQHEDQDWARRAPGLPALDQGTATTRARLARGLSAARHALRFGVALQPDTLKSAAERETVLNAVALLLHKANAAEISALAPHLEMGADLWPKGLATSVVQARRKGPLADEVLSGRDLTDFWLQASEGRV